MVQYRRVDVCHVVPIFHGVEADFIRSEVNSKRSCSDPDDKPSKADFPGFSVFLSTRKPLSYS
jgi:hypothetical protein